jgi:transcriptional regulator with XRE-family HTH domain
MPRVLGPKPRVCNIPPALAIFSAELARYMLLKKTTVNQLALASGIPVSTIRGYLAAKYFPADDNFSLLAKALKINQSKLLGVGNVGKT